VRKHLGANDVFDTSALAKFPLRRILFPAVPGDNDEILAAIRSHVDSDDREFIVLTTEPGINKWWSYSFDDIEAYLADDRPPAISVQQCMMSKHGRWCLWFSDDRHALIGGSVGFVSEICSQRGDPDGTRQALAFAEFWQDMGPDAERHLVWLRPYLAAIYGEAQAALLIRAAGFR
jgi:hypothetical protein